MLRRTHISLPNTMLPLRGVIGAYARNGKDLYRFAPLMSRGTLAPELGILLYITPPKTFQIHQQECENEAELQPETLGL